MFKGQKKLSKRSKAKQPKQSRMSPFKVGDSGFIAGNGPYGGQWSVIVEKIDSSGLATLRFDGIVVPESAKCGVHNPQGSESNVLQPYSLKEVTYRQPLPDDTQKRKGWLDTCATYAAEQKALLAKQQKEHKQMYSHVTVGTKATYKTMRGWGYMEHEVIIPVTVTKVVDDAGWGYVEAVDSSGKQTKLGFGELIF